MFHALRRAAFVMFVSWCCLLTPASACIWDSDTLAAEARGIPGIVDLITGRFERNPPLYYEMRLARVAAEIERDPGKLELYDDAGAACDRLYRGDEAIAWMARKKLALDKTGTLPPPPGTPSASTKESKAIADHWYRYYANLGTFHAHRWVRGKRDRRDMTDLHTGRDLIAKAIAINPDAHFGREKYQLAAIHWLIEAPVNPNNNVGLPFMNEDRTNPEEAVRGLSGLIALGDAWRSLDIHIALGNQLGRLGHSTLTSLVQMRIDELIAAGATSAHPAAPNKDTWWARVHSDGGYTTHSDELAAFFPKARAAADLWHTKRETFMIARMRDGKHPDTHLDFWSGYVEEQPYPLPAMTAVESVQQSLGANPLRSVVLLLAGAAGIAAAVMVHLKGRGRRHAISP